jgi:beta-glucosidase
MLYTMVSLASGQSLCRRDAVISPGWMNFPTGFLWGISTAAHQVEGNNEKNQWSDWERNGRIKTGEKSGLACDWWNNAERDFDLAREMGLNALRMSVEWSRIEPEPNRWDLEAINRYRQMLQGLHRRGIEPMLCLHHFSHPRWFENDSGFLSPTAEEVFERFTRRVVREFGDLCTYWVTFNEPNVFAALGYVLGEFPPGAKGKITTALRILASIARCHERAYRAIHELQPNAQVGWAHNYVIFEPSRRGFPPDNWITRLVNHLFNESFLGVIDEGKSPFPLNFLNGKLRHVKGSCDFVGVNVYSRFHVAFSLRHAPQLFANVFVPADVPQGDRGAEKPYGESYPAAIRLAVERFSRLGKPIYILENGVPDAEDRIRPWLIVNVVKELDRLLAQGTDIRGYFHWTLTDNFEWSEGWGLRFGLVALDSFTQQRTMRPSGHLYSAIAKANGMSLDLAERFAPASVEDSSSDSPF